MIVLTSCSGELQETMSNETKTEDVEFAKLCSSVEQIGTNYGSPETRSINWNKWGGKIFSAAVDGITGYIAGPAGLVVGTLCSWAFDEHWDRCTKMMSRAGYSNIELQSEQDIHLTPTYVFNDGVLTRSDSIGYYHNMILDDLTKSKKEYITVTGEIDCQSILSDCIIYAKKYGIELNISNADKNNYVNFSKDVVKSFYACGKNEITIYEAFDSINTSYIRKFNNKEYLGKTEIFQDKIIETLNSIDGYDNITNYADQVNIIIKDANVSPTLKQDLKTVTDITVNSRIYWDDKQ